MRIVTDGLAMADLARMAEGRFGDLVKAGIDLRQGVMVVDADMHADEEVLLLERGARQGDLWGINLYPGRSGGPDFIEFDSVINIRPSQGNRSRSVEDPGTRAAVAEIVDRLVTP
jgi:hypothetical protein